MIRPGGGVLSAMSNIPRLTTSGATPINRDELLRSTLTFRMREMPDLLPLYVHPRHVEIEVESEAWVRDMLGDCFTEDELDTFLSYRCAWWACMGHATARDDRIQNLADWNMFVWALDDTVTWRRAEARTDAGLRSLYSGLYAILHTDGASGTSTAYHSTPLTRAFSDIWGRIASDMSDAMRDRIREVVDRLLRSWPKEDALRANGLSLDFETYLRLHRDSGGGDWVPIQTEYGLGIDLSDIAATHPEFAMINQELADYFLLDNGMLGLLKDIHSDDINPVVALLGTGRYSVQEAVDQVYALTVATVGNYVRLRDRIQCESNSERSDLATYVTHLGCQLSSAMYWMRVSPRYNGPGPGWNGTPSGMLTIDVPEKTVRFAADTTSSRPPRYACVQLPPDPLRGPTP